MNKIKNLVVSASAGTGKTYRLSLEYIAALSKKAISSIEEEEEE